MAQMTSRRDIFRVAAAGLAASRFAFSQNAPALQVTKLSPNVSVVIGDGGNIAVVTSADSVLLVDAGLPTSADALVATIADKISSKPITTLFNTHWHFDHTGANVLLGGKGTRIISHENTRARLTAKITMEALNRTFEPMAAPGLPTVTFSDGGSIYQGNETLHYTHVAPAHTDTDAYVLFPKSNVLHTGDLFFNGFYPVIDYSTKGWVGGMAAAADKLLAIVDSSTKIIPGHGPIADKAGLQAYRDMLMTVTERLTKLSKQKMPVEKVVAAAPTKDLDAKWGVGMFKPDAWVAVAYTSILRHS